MIAWLKGRLSRDPGQLGLFEVAAPVHVRTAPPAPTPDAAPRVSRFADAPAATVAPAPPPAMDAAAFLVVLQQHGLRGVSQVVFTRNRRTMVSLAAGVLRVHEGFAVAPPAVLAAIATFATSRNRAKRMAARDVIVAHPVAVRAPTRRPVSQHPDDAAMAARLTLLHAQLNLEHFDGVLEPLEILVSRRLKRRLGHYAIRAQNGGRGEIVISRGHVRRDGWAEAVHTLLHEMVHQWQDETGGPVDHGPGFRAKCRAVGIAPAATRMLAR